MYSDADNYCRVRIERQDVVVYQKLAGVETKVASWPMPSSTTGMIPTTVEASGPAVTVTVAGKRFDPVMLSTKLRPGLPLIDLGAPNGVAALDVKVSRP